MRLLLVSPAFVLLAALGANPAGAEQPILGKAAQSESDASAVAKRSVANAPGPHGTVALRGEAVAPQADPVRADGE